MRKQHSVPLVLVAATAADALLGDPSRLHPVAGLGRTAGWLERRLWRDRRGAGICHTALIVAAATAAVEVGERRLRRHPAALLALRVLVLWSTLGARSLERAARQLAAAVERGELAEARRLAPTLVGRDPSQLDAHELCRAAVESLAENTSDALVAPLVYAALFGPAGAAAYRAANTLDAMVGHRSERYRRFGWAAARLDDVLNWLPARLTALLAIACAPLVGGSCAEAWRAAFHDGRRHPSPNAGRVEGAFAGALRLRVGGLNHYPHGLERRPRLGSGRAPEVEDVERAVQLARLVDALALACCGALAWAVRS